VDREQAQRYAEQWIADWNARDLAAVLLHFEDDVAFTSKRALAVVGVATVRGKPALRAYWTKALAAIGSLRFILRRISWDPATSELVIFYERDVDGRQDGVVEVLQFGGSGRVVRAEVYHGLLP
jgi:steroid delta-isomerase